jgi:hypothetical protein
MACKKCGDPGISKEFKCNRCHVKDGRFKWCVITRASDTEDGNLYDEVSDLMITDAEIVDKNGIKKLGGTAGMLVFKRPLFRQGEIFPMEPDFERELGWGRKASKWDVSYEIFSSRDYKKAILRALQASEEVDKKQTNLEMLEQKSIEKEQLTDRQQKLKAAQDPIKLIYDWIKQSHISLKEAKALIMEVTSNG